MQVVVLGPHRSGTSIVTRLINLMGAYFGEEDDAIDAAEDNPKGFWERKDTVAVNEAILEHFGCTWDNLADWPFENPPREIPFELASRITAVVRELDAHSQWVIKDPRLCVTLPYWLPYLSRPVRVVVSRDPGEVAVSLARRNGLALGHALAVWEYSAAGILLCNAAIPTVYVSHDEVLDSPVAAAARLHAELSALGGPGLEVPAREDIERFIDPRLHRSKTGDELDRALLTPHHKALADALAGDSPRQGRPHEISALSATNMQKHGFHVATVRYLKMEATLAETAAATAAVTAASEIEELRSARDAALVNASERLSERDAMIAELMTVRRSWSWRLTSPFRFAYYLSVGDTTKVRYIVKLSGQRMYRWLPVVVRESLQRTQARLLTLTGILPHSTANIGALADIVDERCRMTAAAVTRDPWKAALPAEPPAIDISAVTYNSRKWLESFVASVIALRYPKDKLTLRFVDNSSTDDTLEAVRSAVIVLQAAGIRAEWMVRPNLGFGAGHNAAIAAGDAPFCLVTNVDLEFEADALAAAVATAVADSTAAAWEFRQKPYEHPKYYDPITGTTNWNAHACVLLSRAALTKVGGYDETLFMYGEDVELSYRLRRAGFTLRYCPQAVVFHYSYESPDEVKPTQYTGSTFANLYLRMKYGRPADVLAVPLLALRLLLLPQVFPGSRRQVWRSIRKLTVVAPKALGSRRRSSARFPFRVWDYELVRDGAFVPVAALPAELPLVSVITRTYRQRDQLLRQCLLSVAHQTYPNVEHIVVEDGGSTTRSTVEEVGAATGRPARFIGLDKVGRCVAGNRGVVEAKGRWCLFLDDDDLLFAEHVEVLVAALMKERDAAAAYALSWEITTDEKPGGYVELTHGVPPILRQPFDYTVLRHHNYMAIQSVLFDRRLFVERGGFDEDIDVLEDWMLWIRYAHGGRFAYVPKVTSMFRTPAQPNKVGRRMDAFNTAYPLAVARVEARIRALETGSTP